MSTITCPDRDTWRRFLLGEIHGSEATSCEQHLATCANCAANLPTSDQEDELIATLRQRSRILDAVSTTSGWASGTGAGLDSVISGRGHPAGGELADGGVADGERRRDTRRDEFLDLPQRTDELGRLAGYRVLREIGRGGGGVVYLGEDERLGRRLALKIILDARSFDVHSLARFEREAQLIAQLQHPGIIRLYEAGAHRGRPYLALEYADGGNLAARLAGNPLSPSLAARTLRDLARAVQYAHSQGVVHRDLKPGNVLLLRSAPSLGDGATTLEPTASPAAVDVEFGLLKITDFGLARRLDDDGLTRTGDVLGTVGYMAPEQIDGTARASAPPIDIYALGAMLYEFLTGRPPFRGGSVLETLEQARSLDPVAPRTLRPGLPRDLETICLKTLEREPSRRYGSAAALADDLEAFLDGRPIAARPLGPWGKSVKWARRRPSVAALAVVSSVCVVALACGGVLYERRLRGALQAARDANETAQGAQKKAEFHAQRADANYVQAREAVQKMLFRTKDARWNAVPRLQQLRREQVEIALAFFEGIAAQQDDDPVVQADAVWALVESGKLQLFLDRTEQGKASLRKALERSRSLVDGPDEVRIGMIRADALIAHGAYLTSDRSIPEIEQGLAILEELCARHPEDAAPRSAAIDASITLGAAYVNFKQYEAGRRSLARAIELCDELLAQNPDDVARRTVRARARVNLTAAYRQDGKRDEARQHQALAESELQKLYELDPLDRATIEGLAVLRINGAYDLAGEGRPADAADFVLQNSPMLEAALRREPDDAGYRDRLYRTFGVAATMLSDAGKKQAAAEAWERVAQLAGPDERTLRNVEAVEFWRKAGDTSRAAAAADRATKILIPGATPELWERLAKELDDLAEAVAGDENIAADERTTQAEQHRQAARKARAQAAASPPSGK